MYYAIVETKNDRVKTFMDFETREEAEAHVEKYGGFVAQSDARVGDLKVNGQTVTVEPRPKKPNKGKAIKALLDKLLEDEMRKAEPIPEVADYKSRV